MHKDLSLLIDCARAAGEIAEGHFQHQPKVWDKADDAGPVTEADLAVDKMLRTRMLKARPDFGWLSEETEDDANRLDCKTVFIIDPIDGTRSFIAGSAHWAHSLAIVKDGQPLHAAVYLPVPDLLFSASLGSGAFLNGEKIRVSDHPKAKGANILSAKSNFNEDCWPGGFPDIKRSFRSSLAYRLCLVAQGAFDGMLTLRRTWEWDVAAGSLIASEAGATVTDQEGREIRFNGPDACLNGIVVTNPHIHKQLIAGLTGT